MAQQQQVGSVHTTVHTNEFGEIQCIYHKTKVASYNPSDGIIVLNTGGYFTATTKTRMNQFSNQYNLKFKVYAKRGDWFVSIGSKIVLFQNGVAVLDSKFIGA